MKKCLFKGLVFLSFIFLLNECSCANLYFINLSEHHIKISIEIPATRKLFFGDLLPNSILPVEFEDSFIDSGLISFTSDIGFYGRGDLVWAEFCCPVKDLLGKGKVNLDFRFSRGFYSAQAFLFINFELEPMRGKSLEWKSRK